MKTKIVLLLLLISTSSFAQEVTRFRATYEQMATLAKKSNLFFIRMIELQLNENEESLSKDKYPAINFSKGYMEKLKEEAQRWPKVYKNICIECYEAEYTDQLKRLKEKEQQENERYKKWRAEEDAKRERESRRSDSLYYVQSEKYKREHPGRKVTPYDGYIFAMDMLGEKSGIRMGEFTIFVNMDEELARTRFNFYLQGTFGYTFGKASKQITKPGFVQEHYIRKAAVNEEANDYITAKYYYTTHKELPSWLATLTDEYSPCWLINKVIIEGTPDPIINLYVRYWAQQSKTLGGSKTGEIAHHQFMGDQISLQRVAHNKMRIVITGGGMNYYTSYKILERYNEMKVNQ